MRSPRARAISICRRQQQKDLGALESLDGFPDTDDLRAALLEKGHTPEELKPLPEDEFQKIASQLGISAEEEVTYMTPSLRPSSLITSYFPAPLLTARPSATPPTSLARPSAATPAFALRPSAARPSSPARSSATPPTSAAIFSGLPIRHRRSPWSTASSAQSSSSWSGWTCRIRSRHAWRMASTFAPGARPSVARRSTYLWNSDGWPGIRYGCD
jgi:hypothetical protein